MKTSKLVLGMGTLVLAALPAQAQKMAGAGASQASRSQVSTMASVAPVASPMSRSMAAAAILRNRMSTTDAVAVSVLPTVGHASPALVSIKRAQKFQTYTQYVPVRRVKVVCLNVFPSANYIGASVRFHLASEVFAAPNYIAPSVRFHVAPAAFPLPNFVAPSVSFQIKSGGFAAPNYVQPSMSLQLATAEFPLPVLAGGPMEWRK